MKILVVEDDPVSQRIMVKLLSALGEITTADNGAQGFDKFQEAHASGGGFDLIALDIMMPEMNGQDVLKAIRQFEDTRGLNEESRVKVVMTTALSDAVNVVTAFEVGCEAYVSKPVERKVLYAELRKLGIEPPQA